ncbi:MAG: hypothetical protein KDD37_09160 [Bdellovibrionales bacterium]|nr:hypothetical protein [Bdellovibrionales bacterium]
MSEVEFVKILEKSGFVRQQAEAQVKVMSDFTKNLATKDDLECFATKDDLKAALKDYATKSDLKYEIQLVNNRIEAIANTIIVKLGSLMVALFVITGTVATIVGLWLAKI